MRPCVLYGAARRTVWAAIAFQHPTAPGMIGALGMTVSGQAGAAGSAPVRGAGAPTLASPVAAPLSAMQSATQATIARRPDRWISTKGSLRLRRGSAARCVSWAVMADLLIECLRDGALRWV